MQLKIVINNETENIDHLALYGVDKSSVHKARSIDGHKWIPQRNYNAYPLRSFWALVATFPHMGMSPGAIKLWTRLNGEQHKVDYTTERALDVPRFRYDRLRPNKDGKRRLRPWQVAGIEQSLKMKGYILALDTRLGKTPCYFCTHLLLYDERPRKSLLVTKSRIRYDIEAQAHRLIDDVGLIVAGSGRQAGHEVDRFVKSAPEEHELMIIGYDALRAIISGWCDHLNEVVEGIYIDEAHYIKHEWSGRAKAVRAITEPEHKILGSATIAENGIHEVYSQLNYINPDFFPDDTSDVDEWKSGRDKFEATFCETHTSLVPIRKGSKKKRWHTELLGYKPAVSHLHDILGTYMLRVLYDEVADQLPPDDIPVTVELTSTHKKFYGDIVRIMKSEKMSTNTMAMDVRLRQASVWPGLIDDKFADVESSILTEAIDIINQIDQPTVVFSQFPGLIRKLDELLESNSSKSKIVSLSGTSDQEYFELNQRFQAEEADLYLTTIGISREGAQLDRAEVVIFLDESYVPTHTTQAFRRAANPDNPNRLSVYHMLGKDTYSERVYNRRADKQVSLDFWIDSKLNEQEVDHLGKSIASDVLKEILSQESEIDSSVAV